ncbi:Fasciclin-like arabinogalactan protein 6 [Hibiscus syriacus]|uniref:Fasciclin-like arabinogalactan protein 6 n=1 Tax=Hibiscus syriacus TaxID=106335 RepID=A0A6A3BJI9_HIBSY|nr:fasciclin-like arabinogalactan protein 6 [Hibiscus syriacus]KAE8716197.1 Fasciclin-like arabinogalactan protein 6 [Hibiscus syriacus]
MASALVSSTVLSVFLVFVATVSAQTPPAAAPSGPLNFTGILDKNGQYTYFLRFLADTQVDSQIQNQLKTTTEGFTVFAPTDNAFNNLKPGLVNSLDEQKKVQMVLYHVLPKYYSLNDLQFASNPVRTQATGQDGAIFGLNFTGQNNQVNVSSGVVETLVNNALYQKKPLAVYQLDKVLFPEEFFEAKSPAGAPSPATTKKPSEPKSSSKASEPAAADNSGSSGRNIGLGLAIGIALACMGFLS